MPYPSKVGCPYTEESRGGRRVKPWVWKEKKPRCQKHTVMFPVTSYGSRYRLPPNSESTSQSANGEGEAKDIQTHEGRKFKRPKEKKKEKPAVEKMRETKRALRKKGGETMFPGKRGRIVHNLVGKEQLETKDTSLCWGGGGNGQSETKQKKNSPEMMKKEGRDTLRPKTKGGEAMLCWKVS